MAEEKPSIDHVESKDSAIKTDIEKLDIATNHAGIDNEVAKYALDKIDISPEENQRLLRKIDYRILPAMVITYMIQALDKGTMSFASIMGIREDANLHGQDYSWLTTCVYLAILVSEYPTNYLIQRLPVAKYLSVSIVLWGLVLALQASTKKFAALVVLRCLLGVFESCCQPLFMVMSGMWYKREEQARTISWWYAMNGVNQIIGGLLAYCFSLVKNASLKSWQVLFLVYGCVSIAWGFVVLWIVPDSPMKAKCFSEDEKKKMVERVRENQTGIQNRHFKWYQAKEALMDYQTYAYAMIQFCVCLPSGGLGAYIGIIISSFGFTVLQTQLLSMVLGVYIIILLFSSAYLSRKFGNDTIIMLVYLIPSIVGGVILISVEYDHTVKTQALLLFAYYLQYSYWGTANLSMSLITRNVAGASKKTVTTATTFVFFCVGNAAGPQTFREKDAPRYMPAFATALVCYAVCIVIVAVLRIVFMRRNKWRDAKTEKGEIIKDENLEHAFDDMTDMENLNFRYSY